MSDYLGLMQLPDTFIVALGLHETLRTLGFPAEGIFVGVQDKEFIVSVAEHGKYCAFAVGPCPEDFKTAWPVAARMWNEAPQAEQVEMYRLYRDNMSASKLLISLKDRGLWPRKDQVPVAE